MSEKLTSKMDSVSESLSKPNDLSFTESKIEGVSNDVRDASFNSKFNDESPPKKDFRFWLIILSLMTASYILALDLVGIGNALPIIVKDLGGTQFEWVGSSYALSATAFLPLSGSLAQVFGRKGVLFAQLSFFAAGSLVCGAAPTMGALIVGRTIQGIGAGGIASLTQIIISDLVPLHERGIYSALVSVAYFFAGPTAPIISGSLAQSGHWRWYFFLNIPACGIISLLLLFSVRLRVPRRSFREKIAVLDWIGNIIVIGSTASVVIGLTWGGITFPWTSARVLIPLFLGISGLLGFIVHEEKYAKNPIIPPKLLRSRTAISGYIQSSILTFSMINVFYYLPIYYEACKGATPIGSAVDVFVATFISFPVGVLAGVIVNKTGVYRPQLWFSWIALIAGFSVFSTYEANTSRSASIVRQLPFSFGFGIVMTVCFFPVLAPISVDLHANAMALIMFIRFFSQVWGITVGGVILQNRLKKELPPVLIEQLPEGTAAAIAIVPLIHTMDDDLKHIVQDVFARGFREIWLVLVGICGFCFIISLLMQGLPLHTSTDRRYGVADVTHQQSAADSDRSSKV